MNFKRILIYLLIGVLAAAAVYFVMRNFSSSYPGYKKSANGVYFKVHSESDDTARVRKGSFVTMKLKYGLPDSVMFNSEDYPEPIVIRESPAWFGCGGAGPLL